MSSTAAPSTIAMTIYNLLALEGSARTQGQLLDRVAAHHPGIVAEEITAAVAGLVERNLVTAEGDAYRVADPLRRPAVDRSNEGDGWGAWLVFDRTTRARVPIGS